MYKMKKTTQSSTVQSTKTLPRRKVVTPVRSASRTVVASTRKKVVAKRTRSPISKIGLVSRRAIKSALLSRTLAVTSKIFVGLFFIGTALYGVYSFASNTFAGDVVISKSEIVSRVAKLTIVPDGTPDAVVRVQDADILKKQNPFYENVKEGDYIIMYPTLAVIYSLRSDSIVAIKKTENRR